MTTNPRPESTPTHGVRRSRDRHDHRQHDCHDAAEGRRCCRRGLPPRAFLIGGGQVYLVLWIYGLAVDAESDANFVPLDDADNWLHLALGLGMVALGLALSRPDSDVQRRR